MIVNGKKISEGPTVTRKQEEEEEEEDSIG